MRHRPWSRSSGPRSRVAASHSGRGPIVIGSGPAGMFAALALAEAGYGPLVLERGLPVEERHHDVEALVKGGLLNPESNLLFGEGGAGTYSDGKLTTRSSDPRMARVLSTLAECGADESILIDARPHIGSDVLPGVVAALRRRIEDGGGELRYSLRVSGLCVDGQAVTGVRSASGEATPAGAVVLAAGTSARGFVEDLAAQGVAVEAKPFQVGVRIEHPQSVIDRAVYGRERGHLPPADYIISAPGRGGARGMASFCMCPGGMIVPAVSEPGCLSTNGMSNSRRDGRFANAALVATVTADDLEDGDRLAGLRFQRDLERAAFAVGADLRAPAQRARDFVERRKSAALGESSYPLRLVGADLRGILPRFLTEALESALPQFDRRMRGFIDEGLLVAVEARVSSAVRFTRHPETRESITHARLYPCGEGSGYAGGIMTSAVDGMKSAEALMARFAPAL